MGETPRLLLESIRADLRLVEHRLTSCRVEQTGDVGRCHVMEGRRVYQGGACIGRLHAEDGRLAVVPLEAKAADGPASTKRNPSDNLKDW